MFCPGCGCYEGRQHFSYCNGIIAVTPDPYVTVPAAQDKYEDYRKTMSEYYVELNEMYQAQYLEECPFNPDSQVPSPIVPKCECGAESVGGLAHSVWCPKF